MITKFPRNIVFPTKKDNWTKENCLEMVWFVIRMVFICFEYCITNSNDGVIASKRFRDEDKLVVGRWHKNIPIFSFLSTLATLFDSISFEKIFYEYVLGPWSTSCMVHIWIEKQYVERKICIVITSETFGEWGKGKKDHIIFRCDPMQCKHGLVMLNTQSQILQK